MRVKLIKKITLYSILIIIISLILYSVIIANKNISAKNIKKSHITLSDTKQFLAYQKSHPEKGISSFNFLAEDKLFDYTLTDGLAPIRYEDGLLTGDNTNITWQFNLPSEGRYNIILTYLSVGDIPSYQSKGKGLEIERLLKINDEVPFTEANNIKLPRYYRDDISSTNFQTNASGDEIRPKQVEVNQVIRTPLMDYDRYICEPLEFYFDEGINKLSLISIKEPLLIKNIEITPIKEIKNYKDQLKEWQNLGYQVVKNASITHEAEHIYQKNTPVLIPLELNSQAKASPYNNGNKAKLNVVGIYSWRLPGYAISYQINVPKSGLYALTIKGMQNIKESGFVSRQILINNEIPFKEASYLSFNYSNDLNNYTYKDGKMPYLFYLKEGINTITFNNSLGNIATPLRELKQLTNALNQIYLKIIKYTSVNPDYNRDYQVAKRYPELTSELKKHADKITAIINWYQSVSKDKGNLSGLYNIKRQLNKFIGNIESIIYELGSFQSNISALGTWLLKEQEQPFTMDQFIFHDPSIKLKRARGNIFENLWLNFTKFIYSFAAKTNVAGNINSQKRLNVWLVSSRDNANILRRIIDEEFKDKIGINLDIVTKEALLKATIAGKGPDVALSVPEGTPIDFAFRKAAYDLSQFSDFNEVKKRFYDSAMEPLKLVKNNKVSYYGIPEQQIFPLLFYRKDIFKDLGLSIPKTWDELAKVMNTLNTNNFNFYIESGVSALTDTTTMQALANSVNVGLFSTLLYQNGGRFYSSDFSKTSLDSKISLKSFNTFTEYFTQYKLPVKADFVNRFRSGEIAMGIIDYSTYNTLSVFAPEIKGNWGIANIPSYDGKVGLTQGRTNAVAMILKNTKEPNLAWEFLKWWTSDLTQINYARELETIIGQAARYTTANINALEKLSWPTSDLDVISSQMKNTFGIPQVPGGYMTTRQVNYAFLKVVNEGASPYDIMHEYIEEINKEIRIKRKEFGFE